jgi:hypothetical protein
MIVPLSSFLYITDQYLEKGADNKDNCNRRSQHIFVKDYFIPSSSNRQANDRDQQRIKISPPGQKAHSQEKHCQKELG